MEEDEGAVMEPPVAMELLAAAQAEEAPSRRAVEVTAAEGLVIVVAVVDTVVVATVAAEIVVVVTAEAEIEVVAEGIGAEVGAAAAGRLPRSTPLPLEDSPCPMPR